MKEISTEKKIIDVATDLFARDGFNGTSVREICRLANINISMISYYFGGKKGLYEKVLEKITSNIISYMKESLGIDEIPTGFEQFSKKERIDFLFKAINSLIDYFYSGRISDSEIMIILREQITSNDTLNATGYKMFKKLLASVLGRDENDKEVIFRGISFIAQIHSARLFKQFSLSMMGQEQYSQEDNMLFKTIVINQIKAILKDLGGIVEE